MRYPRKVYAIRHNKTNRVYIGSSANPDVRFVAHINALRANRHKVDEMQKDYNWFGEDYSFTILDTIENIGENGKEYKWQEEMRSNTVECGYNYKDKKWKPYNTREEELLEIIDSTNDRDKMIETMLAFARLLREGH